MRPIKFRVWHSIQKEWVNLDESFFLIAVETGEVCKISGGNSWNCTLFGYVPVQFTGLLDRNGKEIYEGDIFECIGFDGESLRGVVEFKDGAFKVVFQNGFICFLEMLIVQPSTKLIGNKFENPEFYFEKCPKEKK